MLKADVRAGPRAPGSNPYPQEGQNLARGGVIAEHFRHECSGFLAPSREPHAGQYGIPCDTGLRHTGHCGGKAEAPAELVELTVWLVPWFQNTLKADSVDSGPVSTTPRLPLTRPRVRPATMDQLVVSPCLPRGTRIKPETCLFAAIYSPGNWGSTDSN